MGLPDRLSRAKSSEGWAVPLHCSDVDFQAGIKSDGGGTEGEKGGVEKQCSSCLAPWRSEQVRLNESFELLRLVLHRTVLCDGP